MSTGALMFRVPVAVPPGTAAVMVAEVFEVTELVPAVKLADEAPAATVTVAGTVAFKRLDESWTETPPVGAGPVSVTVPVDELPPVTVLGENDTALGTGGEMVRIAAAEALWALAVRVAVADAATGVVVMENVAVVAPAGTVTVAGTVARLLLDLRFTTTPPLGATTASVTVPVHCVPPVTGSGLAARP